MIRRYVNVEVIGLVLLLALGDAVSYYEVSRAETDHATYVENRLKTIACRDLMAYIKDAETSQRGFLLTGQESYLDPYYDAMRKLEVLNEELEKTGLGSNDDVVSIRRLVREKLAEMAETIAVRRNRGAEEALAIVRTNRGKTLMDEIRVIVARVQKENDQAADESRQSLNRSLRTIKYLRGMQTVLAVVLGVMLVLAYRRKEG